MTTLDIKVVGQTKFNSIVFSVAGDLSYCYAVVPKGDYRSIGLWFSSKERAIDFARKTGKLGWEKQVEIYNKIWRWREERFGYLPEKIAKKYASDPYAYGEYVEKIRKKYGIKIE